LGTGFYGSNEPTNSVKALKEDRSKDYASFRSGPPHHAHNNTTTMQYETKTHKIPAMITAHLHTECYDTYFSNCASNFAR